MTSATTRPPVYNLWPLWRMKALTDLDLSGTGVRSLNHIRELQNLIRLRVANTSLRSGAIYGLLALDDLRELDIEDTPIDADDDELESLRAGNPRLRVRM